MVCAYTCPLGRARGASVCMLRLRLGKFQVVGQKLLRHDKEFFRALDMANVVSINEVRLHTQ